MRPAGLARRRGRTAWVTRQAPRRFVSNASRTWSRSASTAALPGVVEDRGVVDEHVEAVETRGRRAHALGVGDVEHDRA